VVDSDKPHIVSAECFHCVADLKISPALSGQIFHHAHADFAALYVLYHLNVARTVKETPTFVIVDVVLDIR
jgi:hypothetical protein